MWKADVVETWIVDKEAYVSTDDFGRDLSSVQTLLTKQETFDIGLEAFENEGIQNISALKDNLVASGHNQSAAINKKYEEVGHPILLQFHRILFFATIFDNLMPFDNFLEIVLLQFYRIILTTYDNFCKSKTLITSMH